ncbi:MAG: hypothetical protein LBL46_00510 [Rickettsiales bacterium]|jgi:uncharacterized membrane protein YgcG|nr:hypothetical protein [Rickettsiales bacterium]
MLSKVKRVFFPTMFFALYASFVGQMAWVLGTARGDGLALNLGLLSLEWLVLVAARYLSKKSANAAGGGYRGGNGGGYRR